MANDSHGACVDSVIGLIECDCSTGQFRGKVIGFPHFEYVGQSAIEVRFLLYTLRHFPLYHAVARVDDCLDGLQAWLQPDEDLTANAK